jgi:hypothetical protein
MNPSSIFASLVMVCCIVEGVLAQDTSNEILGAIQDPTGAAVIQAHVRIRNMDTNQARETYSDSYGRFRFPLLPIGPYELAVEKSGFAPYGRSGIYVRLNQAADLGSIQLKLSGTTTEVTVTADAPPINTTNAEIGVNFDAKRIGELPLASDHNILNLALSVAGVSQLSIGNTEQAASINFSVNGMRLRSNNFLIDGQDSNNLNLTGLVQEINNPDTVAEFRLITNQFGAEYGRAAGSVVNIVTKSGTNQFHGTAYWFYNGNRLNARSNLDKRLFESAPWRIEDQFGATLGGPLIKDKTFFFGSALRWTDRQFASGSITGVPTAEGLNILRTIAGSRPQVRALLDHLPPAQISKGDAYALTVDGQTVNVPLGTLTSAAPNRLDAWQSSARVDHHVGNGNTLGARYLFDDRTNIGGQPVPPGLTDEASQRRQAVSLYLISFAPRKFNELRASYQRNTARRSGTNPKAEEIPSINITDIGLTGGPAASADRTAIGLATMLPSFSYNNNIHVTDVMGLLFSTHSVKFGIDVRRTEQYYLLGSSVRGRLEYASLQNFVDDRASVATFSSGGNIYRFRAYDFGFFVQDEWRAKPNLTLTYGVRYETPGSPIQHLERIGEQILADHNNDPAYRSGPWPKRDTNNWAPRVGFNYRLGQWPGLLGALTGREQLVLRGGYSRTYDQSFNQIFQNIAGAFPFTSTIRQPPFSFLTIQGLRSGTIVPVVTLANQSRTIVGEDLRAPVAEQFSLQLQRELARDWALSAGWVGTKGTALFQTVDGNPTLPLNNNGGTLRVDPGLGAIRLRCNCASSIYHSLQTSLEKRFSSGFSMAVHYTWSALIDDASEVFNASASGDVAISQDSFNRHADRGRSTYDRPHRFAANGVVELPFMRGQDNALGRLLGGWQISGFLTLQSGAPFSPLNGSDPGCRLCGISAQVGNAIRPNLNTLLDLSSMSIEEIIAAGGRAMFSPVTAANPIGNAGRNILRADGIGKVDLGINKSLQLTETNRLQFRAELYNAFNSRNFGIPVGAINSPGFGLQWDQDGGNRRIVVGVRYAF